MRTTEKNSMAVSAVLFFIYAAWCGVMFFVHEPWRDEVHSFLTVRDLDFVTMLSQLRYDGHPVAWFMLLWPLFKLGLPFTALRVLHTAMVLSMAGMVCFKMRNTLFKVFILFGTPMMYEMSAISRNYAMSALALLILALYHKDRFGSGLLPTCFCLFFLINSNIYGTIAGAALVGCEVLLLLSRRFRHSSREEPAPPPGRAAAYFTVAAFSLSCVYLVVFSDVFLQFNPLPLYEGAHFSIIQNYGMSFRRVYDAFYRVGGAAAFGALPLHVQELLSGPLARQSLITLGSNFLVLCGIAGAVVTAREPATRLWAAALSLSVYAGTVLAVAVTGIFNIRHGIPLVFVVVYIWHIALEERAQGPRISRLPPPYRAAGLFLAALAFAGAFSLSVYRSALDIRYPYSMGKEAAAFLRENGYDTDDTLVLATGHPFVCTVLGYTENIKTFRFVYGDCSFPPWQVYNSRYEHSFDLGEFVREQVWAHGREYRTILFISPRDGLEEYPAVFDSRDRRVIMDESYVIRLVKS